MDMQVVFCPYELSSINDTSMIRSRLASSKDRACTSWEAHFGLVIFWACKSGESRAADFRTAQAKKKKGSRSRAIRADDHDDAIILHRNFSPDGGK